MDINTHYDAINTVTSRLPSFVTRPSILSQAGKFVSAMLKESSSC